eukprot:UN15100
MEDVEKSEDLKLNNIQWKEANQSLKQQMNSTLKDAVEEIESKDREIEQLKDEYKICEDKHESTVDNLMKLGRGTKGGT